MKPIPSINGTQRHTTSEYIEIQGDCVQLEQTKQNTGQIKLIVRTDWTKNKKWIEQALNVTE